MEEAGKNLELIDKFIANERKSRMWTTVSVVIFCLLGGAIFLLAWQLNKSNAMYKVQNVELLETQKKLDAAMADLAARNESLQVDSVSLSSQVVIAGEKSDSLRRFCDTITALFGTQSQQTDNNGLDPESRLLELSKSTFGNENIVLSNGLKKQILNPVVWNKTEKPVNTVSIRCMPGYEKIANTLGERLKEKKFIVKGIETIQKISFNPVVKYFHDEDKDMALKISSQLNEADAEFFKNNPVNIQKLSGVASLHHVEVWIGRSAKSEYKRNILESGKNLRRIQEK